MTRSLNPDHVAQLRAGLRGEVIEPGDVSYDETRIVWNGMIDRRPALICRPKNAADVVAAVNFGRDNGLAISIRSGGQPWQVTPSSTPA